MSARTSAQGHACARDSHIAAIGQCDGSVEAHQSLLHDVITSIINIKKTEQHNMLLVRYCNGLKYTAHIGTWKPLQKQQLNKFHLSGAT